MYNIPFNHPSDSCLLCKKWLLLMPFTKWQGCPQGVVEIIKVKAHFIWRNCRVCRNQSLWLLQGTILHSTHPCHFREFVWNDLRCKKIPWGNDGINYVKSSLLQDGFRILKIDFSCGKAWNFRLCYQMWPFYDYSGETGGKIMLSSLSERDEREICTEGRKCEYIKMVLKFALRWFPVGVFSLILVLVVGDLMSTKCIIFS